MIRAEELKKIAEENNKDIERLIMLCETEARKGEGSVYVDSINCYQKEMLEALGYRVAMISYSGRCVIRWGD